MDPKSFYENWQALRKKYGRFYTIGMPGFGVDIYQTVHGALPCFGGFAATRFDGHGEGILRRLDSHEASLVVFFDIQW